MPTTRSSALLAIVRIVAFALFSIPAALLCHACIRLGIGIGMLRQMYFRTAGRILGLKIVVRGALTDAAPQLVVANHVSYLDIFVLGGTAGGVFVAKSEIDSWPLFGWLGRAGATIFVDRRRAATGAARDELSRALARGDRLLMFPEATSNDGNRIRPFKSALFNAAEAVGSERPVTIQPVSIAYTRLNGLPLGIGWRPFFAWYGDMDLVPHVWHALRLGTLTVEVTFHPAVTTSAFADRKVLAKHCERVTGAGVARLLMGREAA